jgi:hypothetical protein
MTARTRILHPTRAQVAATAGTVAAIAAVGILAGAGRYAAAGAVTGAAMVAGAVVAEIRDATARRRARRTRAIRRHLRHQVSLCLTDTDRLDDRFAAAIAGLAGEADRWMADALAETRQIRG